MYLNFIVWHCFITVRMFLKILYIISHIYWYGNLQGKEELLSLKISNMMLTYPAHIQQLTYWQPCPAIYLNPLMVQYNEYKCKILLRWYDAFLSFCFHFGICLLPFHWIYTSAYSHVALRNQHFIVSILKWALMWYHKPSPLFLWKFY